MEDVFGGIYVTLVTLEWISVNDRAMVTLHGQGTPIVSVHVCNS